MTGLSILFVGQMVPGARTGQRVAAFQRLGCDVTIVETAQDMSDGVYFADIA